MTSKTKQRILVALDSLEANEESLALLVTIAARLKASLSALYIEDSRLTEAAGLPFTTEIHRVSAQERNLHTDTLIRWNKRVSTKIQHMLEELSSHHKIPWSFRIEPGEFITKTLSQKGFDVFFPARKRAELTLGTFAIKQAKELNFTLIYDSSPQFQRALEMVRILAMAGMAADITILCETALPNIITEQLLPLKGIKLHIRNVASTQTEALISLSLNSSSLLLLPKQYVCCLPEGQLSELFTRIASPMLLLD